MTTSTTSFLMNCPECAVMIPKGGPCPDCHWSENSGNAEAVGDAAQDMVREFAARRQVHFRNFAIFMVLMFATGLVGLTTAYMWIKVIYFGDIVAFALIGFLTAATGILGVTLSCAKKWFPVDLNCPSCDIRLDELGIACDRCPNCDAQLK